MRALLTSAALLVPLAAAGSLAAAPPADARRVPLCSTGDLGVMIGRTDAGAGQRHATLRLRNGSARTCRTFGFVGMQLLDRRGRALPTDVVRVDRARERSVLLESDDSAFADLHWSAVPGGGEPARGRCEPTPFLVEVTPPDERRSLVSGWHGGAVCQRGRIEVAPLRDRR